ncbi:MAG: anti-sigma factor family protein [Solirubrobacteraceae bacterium]
MTDRPMTCRELVQLVTAYFEDALPDGDRARFEAHVGACDACGTYVEQLRETVALVGRLEPETLSPEMRDTLGQAFRGWRVGRGS